MSCPDFSPIEKPISCAEEDFLDQDNCRQLTDELKRLVAEQKTINDPQCPKSQAIHGAVVFDSLSVNSEI